MSKKPLFIYAPEFKNYSFNADHPFNQQRVEVTFDLIKAYNLISDEQIIRPPLATKEELAYFHNKDYIDIIEKVSISNESKFNSINYGVGTDDTPIFQGMHELTALIVGGTIKGAELIMEKKTDHVLNLAGGLHHAFKSKASGFCIYNDIAVAIFFLRKFYNARVLYIDTDAHHGDGVQWAFYSDPNVLTISIHETGRYLFPGTGNVTERGEGPGYGYSLNIPLDAFSEDDSFQAAINKVLPIAVERFQPDIIISQNGCDAHYFDPLTHLNASMNIYYEIPKLVHNLAHQYTEGRWLALGGGGYDHWRVVPRAWTLLWGIMNDYNFQKDAKIPETWREKWEELSPLPLPTNLFDLDGKFPIIPRHDEILEKNLLTIEKALQVLAPITK